MRARRIENEWNLLQRLQAANPDVLCVLQRGIGPAGEFFRVILGRTAGPIRASGHIEIRDSHQIDFRFPRFFPSTPIEACLRVPIFHPNVDPDNGFVCLWTRTSAGDTIIEALTRMQRIISWDLLNLDGDHVIQPNAVGWYHEPARAVVLPCAFEALVVPESLLPSLHRAPSGSRRQRLFS